MKNFSETEKFYLNLFSPNTKFKFQGMDYKVKVADKPKCSTGEPKTDIYVLAYNIKTDKTIELKISVKKTNADFLENKISAERAEQIFGSYWKNIITNATHSIKDKFLKKTIIYKNNEGRTKAGCITLGWKFELVNKLSGELSGKLHLTYQQLIDVYSGTNLSLDKKNAYINKNVIENSGVANYILIANENIQTIDDLISSLIPINDYCKNHKDIYFACKALNYRTFENKFDGNRPLAVYLNWFNDNGKLSYEFKFNDPLITKGNSVAKNLVQALNELNIKTTDDIKDNII